ncbi:MAG: SDR family oxidoreductase [Opitutales bacterium]
MVITAASTGVGRACARRFAAEGFIGCAFARSAVKLEALATEFEAIHSYPLDVSDAAAVEVASRRVQSDHGRVDVLINNAGVTTGGQPEDAETVDRIIDTNLKGTMYCTFAALPIMRARHEGRDFKVASISGVDIQPEGNTGLYAASK